MPADSRFHATGNALSVADIAALLTLDGPPRHGARTIGAVAPLTSAGPDEIAYVEPKSRQAIDRTAAGALIVPPSLVERVPDAVAPLVCDHPRLAFARVAVRLHPPPRPPVGVSDRASIDPAATLGRQCSIGPFAVIEAGAVLGDNAAIGPGTVVRRGVVIGADSVIDANVTLSHCLIGARVRIAPNTAIGQAGFGFVPDAGGHVPVPQLGRVIIEDECDIGAGVTIDRGTLGDTVVGRGSFIDNLVQLGHNVTLGPGCILAAQSGISGSTRLGAFVALGGQAGLADHLTIGDQAQVGAKAGVMTDIEPKATYLGSPAMPRKQFFRQVAVLRGLVERRGKSS